MPRDQPSSALNLMTRSGLEYWPARKERFVRLQGTAAALGLLSSLPSSEVVSSEEFHTSHRYHLESFGSAAVRRLTSVWSFAEKINSPHPPLGSSTEP